MSSIEDNVYMELLSANAELLDKIMILEATNKSLNDNFNDFKSNLVKKINDTINNKPYYWPRWNIN